MVFSNNGLFQCPPLQGRWREAPEGSHVHKDILYVCVSVGVKPLRPVGPAPLQGGAVPSRRFCYTLQREAGQFCHPHGKQKGRYDPKSRMSRNACENRQIVPFWLIFVTRLLSNPAQIEDFRVIFLHKTGLLCKFLSVSFTFWAVRREISGPEREIPSPEKRIPGLGIFICSPSTNIL